MTVITSGGEKQVEISWDQISFGGKHLSALDKEMVFAKYKNLLSLLLSGPYELNSNTEDGALLTEFGQLYEDGVGGMDYYYGLFDVIALKIERDGYKIYPDIYNNKPEFRKFIQMLTCNFLLLFYEIGCMLGNMLRTAQKEAGIEEKSFRRIEDIYIYLGGNGSKFLNWIFNVKNVGKTREITEANCREMFIVQLQETILDVLRQGFLLCYQNTPSGELQADPSKESLAGMPGELSLVTSGDPSLEMPEEPSAEMPGELPLETTEEPQAEASEDVPAYLLENPKTLNCTISLMQDAKRQMLDGYLFRDMKELFVPDAATAPAFNLTRKPPFSRISSSRSQEFYRGLNRALASVFENSKGQSIPATAGETDMTKVIINTSRSLCEKIIEAIDAT